MTLPDLRDWMSFTTEPANERTLVLIVGVAARSAPPHLAPFLRPAGDNASLLAHAHGAVFPYRPVQRGELPFAATMADLLGMREKHTAVPFARRYDDQHARLREFFTADIDGTGAAAVAIRSVL